MNVKLALLTRVFIIIYICINMSLVIIFIIIIVRVGDGKKFSTLVWHDYLAVIQKYF